MMTAIRAEAKGNTCGGCEHAVFRSQSSGSGYCGIQSNVFGDVLRIARLDAPACAEFDACVPAPSVAKLEA